jgi:hypothetical protein
VKLAKIILINLITFGLLLAAINWVCGSYLKNNDPQTAREKLPNYNDDREHAQEVFHDYKSIQHQYEPFVGWKCLPYHGKTTTISTKGERIHQQDQKAEARAVHFFGGSTMWGEGSDDLHTIPALFNKEHPEYQVYNHAQLAYNSRQELDALISLYSKGEKADVVIFYDGVNDAAFLCPREITQLPAHRLVPMYREKLYGGHFAIVKDLAAKLFLENILKVIHKYTVTPTTENSPYDCLSTPGKAEEIADMMLKNWEIAHEMVTSRGGKFIAILQPAAYISKPRTDHLRLDEELGKNFAEVYKHIQSKIAARNYPWIHDLSTSFDNKDYIFIDFCHVSPNGNAIMTRQISNIVELETSTLVSNLNQ